MRLRLLASSLVFALVSLGCSDEVDNVEPHDGVWNYYAEGTENNTCSGETIPNVDGQLQIDYDGGASFDIEQGDGNDIDCNISGDDFNCPDRMIAEFPEETLNLTIEVWLGFEGTFHSEVEASGEQNVRLECVGEGCGAVSDTYPCAYDLPFGLQAEL